MRERSLSIQSGWSAPTACDPSAAEVAEMLFSLRSGKRSAAELEEEVPAQPEERSSSSTGSACTATAAPAPKPLSKALTATSTRSYVWRGPKKCRTLGQFGSSAPVAASVAIGALSSDPDDEDAEGGSSGSASASAGPSSSGMAACSLPAPLSLRPAAIITAAASSDLDTIGGAAGATTATTTSNPNHHHNNNNSSNGASGAIAGSAAGALAHASSGPLVGAVGPLAAAAAMAAAAAPSAAGGGGGGAGDRTDRDKEWAALTTWLRMNLHHPRTPKREVLFLGRQQEGGRGWVFFLNPALVWDDVSPETKMRLRTLPQETELAFARKYPSKPPRDWVKKSQKYRAPGGAVTHAVPLADMIYSLTAIYYKFEGRPGVGRTGPHGNAGANANKPQQQQQQQQPQQPQEAELVAAAAADPDTVAVAAVAAQRDEEAEAGSVLLPLAAAAEAAAPRPRRSLL
ncbi:hypothetical protein CHLRE_15g634855v5 [Chlamydomonas reinhardtii]|uniref:Uncharacterized protein n=1 Tax=Chlamydomonas reinhardtii TaxID=3055 RepID=A0A2K3CWC4_CHLRE|nr:uncharacterized protein CHLRE_15g634855v5 [Chlamydomonas reinhardtii]PNW72581.1 hypothetical protein CHLRE_15g634855v5 [Chlamydomonas reinhardtii]